MNSSWSFYSVGSEVATLRSLTSTPIFAYIRDRHFRKLRVRAGRREGQGGVVGGAVI